MITRKDSSLLFSTFTLFFFSSVRSSQINQSINSPAPMQKGGKQKEKERHEEKKNKRNQEKYLKRRGDRYLADPDPDPDPES